MHFIDLSDLACQIFTCVLCLKYVGQLGSKLSLLIWSISEIVEESREIRTKHVVPTTPRSKIADVIASYEENLKKLKTLTWVLHCSQVFKFNYEVFSTCVCLCNSKYQDFTNQLILRHFHLILTSLTSSCVTKGLPLCL